MLSINCLIQNTKLYNEVQDLVRNIMFNSVANGIPATFKNVYGKLKQQGVSEIDMQTAAQMYKDVAPELIAKVGKNVLDSDVKVDKITGAYINKAIRRIISNNRTLKTLGIGSQKPSQNIAKNLISLFEGDFIDAKDEVQKTIMKQMQDAIKKASASMVDKQGKKTANKSFEEILNEALRLDSLAITDLNGRLNSMDDLFNQVADELEDVVKKMEKSKVGKSQKTIDEIDLKIQQFQSYTSAIQQGAYTLALSKGEQQKVLRDILKEKYGKQVTSNGVTKTVLDWNKLFTGSKDFKEDVKAILLTKGYTNEQIDKISKALEFQYELLKSTSQWNNVATNSQKKMANDENFISRVVAEIIMSKKDKKGNFYKKYDTATKKYLPDFDKWENDTNEKINDFRNQIQTEIANSGTASGYRQIVSEIARANNPSRKLKKSDLVKLSELSGRHGFDKNFNSKVYNMLGLSEKDAQAGKDIEALTEKIKTVLDKGGEQSKISMSKILDNMNSIMSDVQSSKNGLLNFAKKIEWFMGNRNAYRLINYLNVVENNLSGANQIVLTAYQGFSKEVAKKEFSKMMTVLLDVAAGGSHFDMTDAEKLSYHAHEYRLDETKSLEHNMKAALSLLPNIALGAMDSATHAYTMRMMLYNSAVLFHKSKVSEAKKQELIRSGISESDAEKAVKSQEKKILNDSIDYITDVLYDKEAEEEAYKTAEETLKVVTNSPTQKEIKREADNIMLSNLINKGVLDKLQLKALIEASDIAAKKAIGKESSITNYVTKGLKELNKNSRAKIKKNIQDGNLNKAAVGILVNSFLMKGIFPFLSGAMNWGIIALKKTPLGLYRALDYNKKSFREQVEKAATLSEKDLLNVMESYNTRRNDVGLSIQGMVWTTLIFSALAGMKALGDDDDDFLTWVNDLFKEASKDNRKRKILTRWLPPVVQTYNLLNENVKGNGKSNMVDNAGQLFGYGAMESPITKATKYTGSKHYTAGLGSVIGAAFDVGAYYNAFNSYADLVGEQQEEKVKPHSTYLGDKFGVPDVDFINGIISGMMGYNLQQDINKWTGFTPSK